MKELTHTDCGGELDITWVYREGMDECVEFECRKCKAKFEYSTF